MAALFPVIALSLVVALGAMELTGPVFAATSSEKGNSGTLAARHYVVTLRTAYTPIADIASVQKQFPGRLIYVSRGNIAKLDAYRLRVGFFTSAAEAAAVKDKILASYPNAWVTEVSPAEYKLAMEASKRAQTPATPVKPLPIVPSTAPTAAPQASAEAERRAALLIEQGRGALTHGDNVAAIGAFDQLLRLPPNSYTQAAQELVGLAHERNGETDAARQEYQLYLKLYPESIDTERVRQRLAALSTGPAVRLREPARKSTSEPLVYGGLSQYYYHGASKIETTTTTPTSTDQSTLSLTDQKALVTNLDLGYRVRTESFDNRVVFRDTSVQNFLPNVPDRNRINAAYYEVKGRSQQDYSLRLGRQPGYSGGILGRFDGALAGYAVLPQWRINVVAGQPVDDWSIDTKRRFYGMSLDMGTFAEHWSGSLYTIKQTADSVVDRHAVGGEMRYFDPKKSVYTLIDYDVVFKALNIALLQANWTVDSGTTFNVLADHRKSPALQLINSLIGESSTSIDTMLQTVSYSQLQQQALALTATSDLYLIGLTRPLTAKWQVGGDVRVWSISGTAGSANQPPTPATGDIYTYTVQAIGTGVLTKRDISLFNYSLIDAPTYTGDSASVTNRSRLTEKLTLDVALRWYRQHDQLGVALTRLTPTVRFTYQWREHMAFETEFGIEDTTTKSSATEDVQRRNYWSLGYRWDF